MRKVAGASLGKLVPKNKVPVPNPLLGCARILKALISKISKNLRKALKSLSLRLNLTLLFLTSGGCGGAAPRTLFTRYTSLH